MLQLKVEVAPYWNVNDVNAIDGSSFTLVEVAPYWNVNKGFTHEELVD